MPQIMKYVTKIRYAQTKTKTMCVAVPKYVVQEHNLVPGQEVTVFIQAK
jgi:hypothetical protein